MKTANRWLAGLLTAAGIALATPALAVPTIQEGFNENETPTTANWAINSVGWFWTPESDFSLVGIQTRFFDQGGDPTITVLLMDDRGGNILRQADFSAASAKGQLGGGIFATPIDVSSATTYFVGFENTDNLGVNVVGSNPDVNESFEGAPPGLFFFGVVAAVVTERTGRLGTAIWCHVGFNLTTVILLLT